ncbi:MAG: hypothetical protein ACO1SX_07140 [Actinomycetota bacterium]
MANPTCALCQGDTAPCSVLQVLECHGRVKQRMGVSKIRCGVAARVCVECGYLMFFAETPRPFRQEIVEEAEATDRLPIPSAAVPA